MNRYINIWTNKFRQLTPELIPLIEATKQANCGWKISSLIVTMQWTSLFCYMLLLQPDITGVLFYLFNYCWYPFIFESSLGKEKCTCLVVVLLFAYVMSPLTICVETAGCHYILLLISKFIKLKYHEKFSVNNVFASKHIYTQNPPA